MKIAITGTREGMTIDQWNVVEDLIGFRFTREGSHQFHCGDCVGADTQALGVVNIIKKNGGDIETHGWPGRVAPHWKAGNEYDVLHPELPPMERNRHMVSICDFVIAAPKEFDEQIRGSGTWGTIRYAKRLYKHLIIVFPDATVQTFND